MWECPDCGALNSPGMDSCCGQPKPLEKARSAVKPKLAADETRKLRKLRPRPAGQSRPYCTVCGKRVIVTKQAHIFRLSKFYIHHECVPETIDD